MWVYGEEYLPNANVKYGIECSEAARSMGFENGDKILKVNNLEVDNFAKVVPTILLENATSVTVERNGLVKEIVFDEENISRIIKMQKKQLIAPRVPFVVQKVVESGGAYKAGVKKNDVLIGVGDSALVFYDQFSAYFQGHKSTSIPVKLLRNKDTLTIVITSYSIHYTKLYDGRLHTIRALHFILVTVIASSTIISNSALTNYVITSYSIHYTKLYDRNYEENNSYVFSRMNGTWLGAPVNYWDFSRYASGVIDRRQNFLRITSYNVCYTKL